MRAFSTTRGRSVPWWVPLAIAVALSTGALPSAHASIKVNISASGGSAEQVLPDEGGSFDMYLPLNRNAVNAIKVTAEDSHGQRDEAELAVTQVSLNDVVVSRVTTARLDVEEIERLVADGTIDIDDPENYNVSRFTIVMTIDKEPVSIDVPIVMPKQPPPGGGGGENIRFPFGPDGPAGRPPPPPPVIIVFAAEPSTPPKSKVTPPPIPGILVIEGRIKSLKEFFSVRLLLMNASGIFTLSDVGAELRLPGDALTAILPADGVVSFGDILPGTVDQPGQIEKEFVVRGDLIGVHDFSIDFGGIITGPGIDPTNAIPFSGTARGDLEVKGPPQFDVTVDHPDSITAGEEYTYSVEIKNTGELVAMYASLEMDMSGDALLGSAGVNVLTGAPEITFSEEPVVRSLGHIHPGESLREVFTAIALSSGRISSAMGMADQNITLRVGIGDLGAVVGQYPPNTGALDAAPTVSVLPFNNAQGISTESPVVAFFSELMSRGSITTGSNGTFNVFGSDGGLVPGKIRFLDDLAGRTIAAWQVNDGILNRLEPRQTYEIVITDDVVSRGGAELANPWQSRFRTTSMGEGDIDPPRVTLSVEPPVDPNYVLPGELVRLNAYATDQGSGIARVELRTRDLNSTNVLFTLVDQKTVFDGSKPPFIFTLDSANLVPGHTYLVKATAFDNRGNPQSATVSLVISATADPPTIVLPADPALPQLQGIGITLTPTAMTGGVRQVRYYLDDATDPYTTVRLPPWQATLSTLALAQTNHTVRALAIDGLGQTGEDSYRFDLINNPNMPVIEFHGAGDGVRVVQGELFALTTVVKDDVGVKSVNVYVASPATSLVATSAGPLVINTASLELGSHRIYVLASNLLDVANEMSDPDSYLEFEVVRPPPGPPPAPPVIGSLSPPEDDVARFSGSTALRARVIVSNATSGVVLQLNADVAGAFSGAIAADEWDRLVFIVYDDLTSDQPSAGVERLVPGIPVLERISLSPTNRVFTAPGQYVDLNVTGHYRGNWTSNLTHLAGYGASDTSIASVDTSGRVVAVARGTSDVRATVGTNTAVCRVTVDYVTVTNISVMPQSLAFVAPGQSASLTVTAHYNTGASQPLGSGVTFVSGDPGIVMANSAGLVTAIGDGMTDVTVYRAGLQPVAVSVRVDTGSDPDPTVAILSPANGAFVGIGSVLPVSVLAQDPTSGVTRIHLVVTGSTEHATMRQLSPPSKNTTQVFNVPVSHTTGAMVLSAWAEDTSGHTSSVSRISLRVVDDLPPEVRIAAPARDSTFAGGSTVTVSVVASDDTGVSRIEYYTTGALSESGRHNFASPSKTTNAVFTFVVPRNLPYPDLLIHAVAYDTLMNVATATPVPVVMSDADVTPPETIVTAVSNPGVGTAATVDYRVTDGLEDLDYVAVYFRRNGVGTFNRYTDADGGNPRGEYHPQAGANGFMTFDTTRMGGDGLYEFYSVGVDETGNREPPPTDTNSVVVADRERAFSAGTVWTVITANLTLAATNTSYDGRNVRIDGATLTLEGHHTFHNVELTNGGVLTHPATTVNAAYGIDVEAWTLTVGSNSAVNVDARGYLGGERGGNTLSAGRTDGNVGGSTERSGGSYGGLGGISGGTPNALYGNLTAPSEPGSGGSRGGSASYPGGNGGGRARVQAVNIVNDGTITANGQNGGSNGAGSGSGGGIYLVVSTASGRGSITANGAGYEVGGGGGRIALHYIDIDTLDTALIQTIGGQGSWADGGNGTVFLKSVEEDGGTLVVDGQGVGSSFSALPIPPGYVFDNITIRNAARVVADDELVVSNKLEILTGSIVTHSLSHEDGLLISCARLEIDASSSIDVSGRGYRGGERDGNTWSEGRTLSEQRGATERCGGSYGGVGAVSGGRSNPVYGNPHNPILLGSGGSRGGSASYPGGNGGGRVDITASVAVAVEGTILAGGQNGGGNGAGSGSGGSIKIDTSLLRGTGTIAADGGAYEVGGSGGRVWIGYDYSGQTDDDFNGLRNIHAFGGKGNWAHAGAGTVVLQRHNQAHGDLYIDDNVSGATAAAWTPLPHIGFGEIQDLSEDTLTTDGKVTLLPGGLVGLELNPNSAQGQTFTILSNAADTITVDVSGGANLTDIASVGDEYAGVYRFDNVFFRRGGYLVLGDELHVGDTMWVDEYGRVTHFDAGSGFESRLDLTVDTLHLTSTGFIDANTRGYVGGERPGSGGSTQGHTLGDMLGSTERAGGSYGGLGGVDGAGVANSVYGSLTQPAELGSGGSRGGSASYPGGDGGGRIHISAAAILNDGVISVIGQNGFGNGAGSGSGGCIEIQAGSLGGDGFIRANGGGFETAGGGGRIAIRYDTLTLPESHIEALGGQGGWADGGNGTIFLKQTAQTHGNLIVDGLGAATPTDKSIIPGGYTFDNIILRNRADVIADNGLTVTGQLSIQTNSVLRHTLNNEAGLQVTAGSVAIDETSAIDVSQRGYRGGERAGNTWSEGRTLSEQRGATERAGGSYGGLGAAHGSGVSGPVYGDPKNPVYLGSGGSRGGSTSYPGGNGGGRVDMTVAGELMVDGAIRANGQIGGQNGAGSGSGGSIRIETGSLTGTGVIAADGAAYEVGGGGGRVAVTYTTLGGPGDNLDDLRNIHTFGGHGSWAWGSAGTVVLRQNSQSDGDLYVDDNVVGSSSPVWTPLTPVYFGTIQSLTANTLVLDGKKPALPGGLAGLRVNPNLEQDLTFAIIANTSTSIVVDVSSGTNLTDVATVGDKYGALHAYDNVLFRRGGFLVLGDTLRVNDTIRIEEYGRLTHHDATTKFEGQLRLLAGNCVIASGAAITVDARGYLGGERGDNTASQGRTLNNAIGSTERSGGSYGGLGGASGSGAPNPVYGSLMNPADLGSGGSRGGSASYPGGDGGGRIYLAVGNLQVDGLITAGGQVGGGNGAGSGSGGSIYIEAGALSGIGTIQANGGGYEVAGGGGRIAIYFPAASGDTNNLTITSAGGSGNWISGSAGTVYLDDGYTWTGTPSWGGRSVRGTGTYVPGAPVSITALRVLPNGKLVIDWSPDDANRRIAGTQTPFMIEFTSDITQSNWVPIQIDISGLNWTGSPPFDHKRGFFRIRRME